MLRPITASRRTVLSGSAACARGDLGLPGLGDWGGTFPDLLWVEKADFALTPAPSGVDPAAIASVAENLPFGWEFTVPDLEQSPGADVLVMGGCGAIALYAIMFAVAAGAARVQYHDTDPGRLWIAERYGARIVEGSPPRWAGAACTSTPDEDTAAPTFRPP